MCIDTKLESGFPDKPEKYSAADDLEVMERSMNVLRLLTSSQEDARNVSWKKPQKAAAAAPPIPLRPSKNEPIDPSTVGPRFRAKTKKSPGISELTQGTPESDDPPLK